MSVTTGKNGEIFLIRRAATSDVEGIMTVMDTAKRLADAGWFVSDERGYVEEHIEEGGFVVTTQTKQGETAGFFMVDFPGETRRNLGRYLGLEGRELNEVVHMDSAAVLPQYRGSRLQEQMMKEAEEILDQTGRHRYRMATVHPENIYSLNNMKKRGYTILTTVQKYGGLPRHIMWKKVDLRHGGQNGNPGQTR